MRKKNATVINSHNESYLILQKTPLSFSPRQSPLARLRNRVQEHLDYKDGVPWKYADHMGG